MQDRLERPAGEHATVQSCLREADFLTRELKQVDREIARYAVGCPEIRRLMTIPGVDVTTAATLMVTIGRIDRFPSPRHLVGYCAARRAWSATTPTYTVFALSDADLQSEPKPCAEGARRYL